jgi:hypothetical protein
MGIFSSQGGYSDAIKNSLMPKDGKTHVLLLNHFSSSVGATYPTTEVDHLVDKSLNEILIGMQGDRYEIIDIKITALTDDGKLKGMCRFASLITYK